MEKTRTKSFLVIYATAAAAFLILLIMDISGIGRTILKAIPVSTLFVWVFREVRDFPKIGLCGALIASVSGDILLDLSYAGIFIFGLVSFLVAHIFYSVLFFRYAKRPDGAEKVMIAVLVLLAGVMIWIFHGISPALYGPVVLYILVIITMSIGALLVPAGNRLLFVGALMFIASDIVLAVNKFLVTIPYGRAINIALYFTAQFIIIRAALSIWADKK